MPTWKIPVFHIILYTNGRLSLLYQVETVNDCQSKTSYYRLHRVLPAHQHSQVAGSIHQHIQVSRSIHQHSQVTRSIHQHIEVTRSLHQHTQVTRSIHDHIQVTRSIHDHIQVTRSIHDHIPITRSIDQHQLLDSLPTERRWWSRRASTERRWWFDVSTYWCIKNAAYFCEKRGRRICVRGKLLYSLRCFKQLSRCFSILWTFY